MFVKYPKEDGKYEKAIFYTCLVLYALTSLAISGGVLYLVLCVPQGKLPLLFGSEEPVPVPAENSLELDSSSTGAPLPAFDSPAVLPDEISSMDKDDLKIPDGVKGDDEVQAETMGLIDNVQSSPSPEILILDVEGDTNESEDFQK